jgi:hypothetical protein
MACGLPQPVDGNVTLLGVSTSGPGVGVGATGVGVTWTVTATGAVWLFPPVTVIVHVPALTPATVSVSPAIDPDAIPLQPLSALKLPE